jgi:hypothetical protein
MDALKLGMKQGFQGQTGAQRHGDFKDNISKYKCVCGIEN